jgi:protein O-GlcNAc transferase
MSLQFLCDQAVGLHQKGNLADAEKLYRQVLAAEPRHFTACHHLGMIRAQKGDYAAALKLMGAALAAQPGAILVLVHHGNVLSALDRLDEALASYDRALAINPDNVEALFNRANALYDLKRFPEALAGYYRSLALKPDFAEALNNRGNTLRALRNFDQARESYDRALAIRPDYAGALYNRGNVLRELKRFAEALADFDRILAAAPDNADALRNRGNLLQDLSRFEESLTSYDKALAAKPDDADALNNRGSALRHLKRFDEALASYDGALAVKPDYAMALYNRGMMQWTQHRRLEAAIHDLEKLVRIDPDYEYARGDLLHLRMHGAIWREFDQQKAQIDAGVHAGRRIAKPFVYQAISNSPADLQACAVIQSEHLFPAAPAMWKKPGRRHAKIRVGYVSGEFRNQATAFLTAGLYEAHDKSKFEIVAFDNGWSDNSPVRQRMEAAFDRFVDIAALSDRDAAEKILSEEIDILVNLNGYFGLMRMGVFAQRPAPIQVNYLGFPGTLGAGYIDYILADRFVIPPDEQRYYTERVITLPDTWQVNDSKRRIAQTGCGRSDNGLPETAFVFCSFNNSYKLTPEIFAIWMRILKQVDGSVLWLLESNTAFAGNIRREAERHGIAAERLVFAPRLPMEEHLARLPLADLFLDTLPYNAHTTASDALWAGLPLITCRGTAFPGRVATSLLHAVDLPELITENLEAYEALALKLAGDPALLQSIRGKLARNRLTTPLFDTDRFRRHIEAAYATMWEIFQRGESPRGFNVAVDSG